MIINNEQKRRYDAFWNHEKTDRACLYITSWDGSEYFRAPKDIDEQWGDMEYREAAIVHNMTHTRYFAEGFPSSFTNFGPGNLTASIGGSYQFAPQTVWFENRPFFVEDWDNRPTVKLDRTSKMYTMVEDLSLRCLSHKDLFVTSICDIGGTYDIIAALRGTENLLYDMYDSPEDIKKLRDEIAPIWKEYFIEQSSRLLQEQGCMTSWMPIWSDKSYYPLQCDYSAMLSPDMFGEFILPDLASQIAVMDRSIYHLDGPGEIPHLEQLLSLKDLSAIQWVSGAGAPPVTDPCWFDMYHRIQEAGKSIILLDVNPAGLEELFKNVSQRGLYISLYAPGEREAQEIIDMATKLNF